MGWEAKCCFLTPGTLCNCHTSTGNPVSGGLGSTAPQPKSTGVTQGSCSWSLPSRALNKPVPLQNSIGGVDQCKCLVHHCDLQSHEPVPVGPSFGTKGVSKVLPVFLQTGVTDRLSYPQRRMKTLFFLTRHYIPKLTDTQNSFEAFLLKISILLHRAPTSYLLKTAETPLQLQLDSPSPEEMFPAVNHRSWITQSLLKAWLRAAKGHVRVSRTVRLGKQLQSSTMLGFMELFWSRSQQCLSHTMAATGKAKDSPDQHLHASITQSDTHYL